MKARYWVIATVWIATIAIAFVAGRGQAPESEAPAPSTVAGPAEPPPIGRALPSPSRLAPSRPPSLGFDVRTVRDAVLPPPSSENNSVLGHLIGNLEAVSAELEGEERDQLIHHLATSLVNFDPSFALQWAAELDLSDPLREKLTVGILSRWANRDPEAAMLALANLTDPSTRMAAVDAMAINLAMKGTERAVTWADTLPTTQEQDAAHAAIYDATPRGIGVRLNFRDGIPRIDGLIPNGAAEQSGQIRNGDRIVAVDPGLGQFHDLEGRPLEEIIRLIRGENGASLRLRIARDTDSGPQTIEVPLTRGQVILPER